MNALTVPTTGPATTAARLRDESGIRFARAEAAVVLAVLALAALDLPAADATALLALATLAAAHPLRLPVALGVGASAWAFATGFLEHSFGQLSLDGHDLVRLGVLLLAAALGSLLRLPGGRRG